MAVIELNKRGILYDVINKYKSIINWRQTNVTGKYQQGIQIT